MCPFEILHFAPLVLIAASLFALRISNNKLAINLIIIALSALGLFAGEHMHHAHDHLEPVTILDPCFGYVASLLVSGFSLAKSLFVRLFERNEA